MRFNILNDLYILFWQQSRIFRATEIILGLLLIAILLAVIEAVVIAGIVRFTRWYHRVRARRYLNKVVKLELAQIRRRELDAAARIGGRS